MAYQFSQRRRVTFAETDLAGIMHFSNFFRWMEEAEHAFYRSLGLSVHPLAAGETVTDTGWPRLKASAEYFLPLRFEEEAEVELMVAEMRTKAMRHVFRIWKNPDDPASRALAAVGEFVVVAVAALPGTKQMKGVPIPEVFRSRIQPAPPDVLKAHVNPRE